MVSVAWLQGWTPHREAQCLHYTVTPPNPQSVIIGGIAEQWDYFSVPCLRLGGFLIESWRTTGRELGLHTFWPPLSGVWQSTHLALRKKTLNIFRRKRRFDSDKATFFLKEKIHNVIPFLFWNQLISNRRLDCQVKQREISQISFLFNGVHLFVFHRFSFFKVKWRGSLTSKD